MRGRFFRLFIIMSVFASTAILTGCPSLPEGKVLGVRGDVTASGNVFRDTGGWTYIPIGGEITWTLSNTSDWQYIQSGITGYYANDTIPASKVSWLIAQNTWSKPGPSLVEGVFTVTREATDWIYGATTPNFYCSFLNQANPPFRQESASTYTYVNVIKPSGSQLKCATKQTPPTGLQYHVAIELIDISGTPSRLNWNHCVIKEFLLYRDEGCGPLADGREVGDGGPIRDRNLYGDDLLFDVPDQEPFTNSGFYCVDEMTTAWRIASNSSYWYDVELATYHNIFFNFNGDHQAELLRNGVSADEMPTCSPSI